MWVLGESHCLSKCKGIWLFRVVSSLSLQRLLSILHDLLLICLHLIAPSYIIWHQVPILENGESESMYVHIVYLSHHFSTSFPDPCQKKNSTKASFPHPLHPLPQVATPSNTLLYMKQHKTFFLSSLESGNILPYITMLFSCLATLYTLSQLFAMQFNS